MTDAYWLVWYIAFIKSWLGEAIAAEITAASSTQTTSTATHISIDTLHHTIYEYVRIAAYMAWLGQILFMRLQAASHGTKMSYTPSMQGVSPRFVHNVLREELRLVNGHMNAPINDICVRVNRRLTSIVPSIARRTAVKALEDTPSTRTTSTIYALEHGSPVGRFLTSVYANTPNPIQKIMTREPELHHLLDHTINEFNTAYDRIHHNPPLTITRAMIATWGELHPNLTPADIEVFGEAWKCAALAEIDLVDDFPVYPNTWYYEWVRDRDTGKTEYIVPPKNAVFRWLVGELGSSSPARYMTVDEYRQRAREVVESKSSEWFARQNVRWARIPTGAYTCAFCLLLASRGAVYKSSESAGLGGFDHDDCDCLVVPVYDTEDYPFKEVVDAARNVYRENKDLFALQYSRNLYETTVTRGKNKGLTVMRHKRYVYIGRERLAEITSDMPRVDNSEYQRWVEERMKKFRATLRAA